MWSLIIFSHFLMFVSFVMLCITSIQGHFAEHSLQGTITLRSISIYSIIIYIFTQTLVLFLVIAINKQFKKLISEHSCQGGGGQSGKFYLIHG